MKTRNKTAKLTVIAVAILSAVAALVAWRLHKATA